MSVNSTENWLEGFEIKIFSSKHEVLSEYSNLILSLISSLFLELNFFQNPRENFLWDFTSMFEVSEMFAWPRSLRQWKNRDRKTYQSDYMSGKVKKVEILTKWSSKWGWNILTKPHILSWNFFSKASRNFLTRPKRMLKVSKRCPERSLLRS